MALAVLAELNDKGWAVPKQPRTGLAKSAGRAGRSGAPPAGRRVDAAHNLASIDALVRVLTKRFPRLPGDGC